MSSLRRTSARASSWAREYVAPVGLDGELRSRALVAGEMWALSSSAVRMNPFSSLVGTMTDLPLARVTRWGYVTQNGAGMMTSSPSLTRAWTRWKSELLAPVETMTSFGP